MAEPSEPDAVEAPEFGTFRYPRSFYYAVYEPHKRPHSPPPLLLAFHGYGQSSNSFIKPLHVARDRGIMVVAPQAPNQFYWSQGNAAVGFTWMTRYQRDNSLADNRGYLAELVKVLKEEYVFDPDRVYALGFSQGCAMAFRFAESGAIKLHGVVGVCGDLPKDVETELHSLEPFPVLLVHGKEDPVVAMAKSEEARDALSARNFPVETDFFDGGHELPEAKICSILDWIQERADEKGTG
jgi:phospholipase/carboxylesterase